MISRLSVVLFVTLGASAASAQEPALVRMNKACATVERSPVCKAYIGALLRYNFGYRTAFATDDPVRTRK